MTGMLRQGRDAKSAKVKRRRRVRPGQTDPQAAPRKGSAPYPGLPHPLGATPYAGGTNFAVIADGAPGISDVQLCLQDPADPSVTLRTITMNERTYGVWHTFVPDVGPGQVYGFRVPARDPAKLLLDPYARQVTGTDYDLVAAASYGAQTAGRVPAGIVVDNTTPGLRSTSLRPWVPWEQTVLYEGHVRGLTMLHPAVPPQLRGTFAGVSHPAVIEHLQQLHVTTLELLPIQANAAEPSLQAIRRSNYWGYSTLAYFAPHPGYAAVPGQEIAEFAAMVDALHQAGIEVVLDVVYNHTCEGGPGLSVDLSTRGLAPESYFLPDGRDLTGTGNTVNARPLPVIRLVTDSLRYWADTLGVDGFRFDLASVHARPDGGPFDAGSALLSAIAADPVLSTRKLIAEPWDATGDGYAVGGFGPNWTEWNDRFRDTNRDFWRGVPGVRDLGYRLSGSSDLYAPSRRPWASINFITAHDGFTLRDLVSYNHKHNEANGENNRDGSDHNRSWNHGVEGETDDPAVIELRTRTARNLAACLLLSTGTPMITMGDELWRTQRGNNNPYCQDNEISWVNWDLDARARDMLVFCRRTLGIRRDAPALRQAEFFEGRAPVGGDRLPDLVWFNPSGEPMTDQDWFDEGRQTLGMWINGHDVRGHTVAGQPLSDRSWLLVLHAGDDPIELSLPGMPYSTSYVPTLDTDRPTGEPVSTDEIAGGSTIPMPGRTVWLLRARRHPPITPS